MFNSRQKNILLGCFLSGFRIKRLEKLDGLYCMDIERVHKDLVFSLSKEFFPFVIAGPVSFTVKNRKNLL